MQWVPTMQLLQSVRGPSVLVSSDLRECVTSLEGTQTADSGCLWLGVTEAQGRREPFYSMSFLPFQLCNKCMYYLFKSIF